MFLGGATLIGAIGNLDFKTSIIGIAAVLALGIVIAHIVGHQHMLPNTFIDELATENHYTASYCTADNLHEACEMTRPYFGKDYQPHEIVEQWRLRNPQGFVQILNSDGILCACFVILGLKDSFTTEFVSGRVTEGQITSEIVLTLDESKKSQRLYISGVVVRDPGSLLGSKRARVMLWAIIQYIRRHYSLRAKLYFAVAMTRESERLLKSLKFDLLQVKTNRTDSYNLYGMNISKKSWGALIAIVGDFSSMCDLNWNFGEGRRDD